MRIELFYAPGCSECSAALTRLKEVAQSLVNDIKWHEIDPVDGLDHAVDLGVITLPSIAIDGKLVFTSLPSMAQWREALTKVRGTDGR